MGRKPKFVVETKVNDGIEEWFKNLNLEEIKTTYENKESQIVKNLAYVYNEAQKIYNENKANREALKMLGLRDMKSAYEKIREFGFDISFRAFAGRVERGTIPSIKIGKKRYILEDTLNKMAEIKNNFYTVKEAFEKFKDFEPNLNFRAFIGRIEKGTIDSVKINTQRLIPKEIVEKYVYVAKNYYDVVNALKRMHEAGIKIKRNAFERRLDRGRIPHIKIAGKRYIHKDVLEEVIRKELNTGS